MSRHYSNNSYEPSRRHVIPQSHPSPNTPFRRHESSVTRDFDNQSTFQPTRQRDFDASSSSRRDHGAYSRWDEHSNSTNSSFNRMNNRSNDQSNRQYRIAAPSNHSNMRYPQYYPDDYDDRTHSSDHYHHYNQPTSTNYSPPPHPHPRRHNYPTNNRVHHGMNAYPSYANHIPLDTQQPAHQHSGRSQSLDRPSSPTQRFLIHENSDPVSLLTNVLQNFFPRHNPSFNNENYNDHLPVHPIGLMALASIIRQPNVIRIPATIHLQFGDLFDMLAHEQTMPVGLSDTDINRLPTMPYRKTNKSESVDDTCTICLSEYKPGETVKRLRCKHIFHPECIDPWLKTSNQCPICRGSQID